MRHSALFLFSFAIGCSDYAVSAIKLDQNGAFDTGTPYVADQTEPESDPEPETEDDCVEASTALDMEQVSSLQDAFGLPNVRDGLTLSVAGENIAHGSTWRPVSVKVLVMYPTWYFDFYDDSNSLTVNFYPAANPTGASAVSKTVQIRKADLEWEELLLPADADWSGDDREQMAAWLEFDIRNIVLETGYTSSDYFVSLGWDSMGFPNVGYSNFELNCPQNWTDYGSGSYTQNSGQDCSWPMLKIEIETVNPGDCD